MSDEQLVRNVMTQYVQGSYEADIGKLREVFDPNARMNGFLGGDLVEGSPEPFFQDLSAKPSLKQIGAEFRTQIEFLSIAGNVASVVLRSAGWGPKNFVDLFHLMKKGGSWVITTKTFTTYE